MAIPENKPSDILHNADSLVVNTATLKVRSNFAMSQLPTPSWESFSISDWGVNCNKEHIASEAEFTLQYEQNQLNEASAESKLREFSEILFIVDSELNRPGENLLQDTRTIFHGFIDVVDIRNVEAGIHAYDPLAFLGKIFMDFGVFEAEALDLEFHATDPNYTPASPVPPGVDHGITLIPVTENGEERWIIPSHYGTSASGPWTAIHQDAYTNDESDEYYGVTVAAIEYPAGSGHWFKAGLNRRQIKVAGRVFDDTLDLEPTYGQEVSYADGDSIPPANIGIGTDIANYFEMIGFPPSGYSLGDVFTEWVQVYIEGTNDIEHIILKAINPVISGRCSTTVGAGATTLTAELSHFIRDCIVADGIATVQNLTTGETATISSVDTPQQITHGALTSGWTNGDNFEITSGCGKVPRYRNGVHYEYDATKVYQGGDGVSTFDLDQTDYETLTVFPSGVTISRFEWNSSDGSILKMIEVLMNEYAPPNYRIWWDHSIQQLRAQFVEHTPFQSGTYYYGDSNTSGFKGFAYGKFIEPPDPDASDDGTNDYHLVYMTSSQASPHDEQGFMTRVIVQGIREHPVNLVMPDQCKIYTMCPGTPNDSSWPTSGPESGNWDCVTGHGLHNSKSYAEMCTDNSPYTLIRANLTDLVIKTAVAWEAGLGIGYGSIMCPFLVLDLGYPMTIGRIELWTLTSFRPEFNWNYRIQCCLEDGITDTGGKFHHNASAKWQLMHSDWYAHPMGRQENASIRSDWLTNYCRYILISSTYAKTHSETWCMIGLSELGIYREETVKGEARIGDLSSLTHGSCNNDYPLGTTVTATTPIFNAGMVGSSIANLTSGFVTTITGFVSTTQVTVAAGGYWDGGDVITVIEPNTSFPPTDPRYNLALGEWARYRVDSSDPLDYRSDGAVSICNLPILHGQCHYEAAPAWNTPSSKLSVGHRAAFHNDPSLANTNACAERAEEILIETVREFTVSGCKAKWHNGLELFKTATVKDSRTGQSFRVFVENITYSPNSVEFDAVAYSSAAWTGEQPAALPPITI